MIAEFYINNSPSNQVLKQIQIVFTSDIYLKTPTNIVNPEITLKKTPEDILSGVNYCYIDEFQRYYYVTNIVSLNKDMWGLTLQCDVLMSFRDTIYNQLCIVERQEHDWNTYLADSMFMAYQNPAIVDKYFSVEHPFDTFNFVLITAGDTTTP